MSKTERLSQKMEKLLKELRANHHGPKLWLLSPSEIARYRDWQTQCSEIISQYPPGGYYEAILNETAVELPELPRDIAEALGLDGEPPTIPADASLSEAFEIYARNAKLTGI